MSVGETVDAVTPPDSHRGLRIVLETPELLGVSTFVMGYGAGSEVTGHNLVDGAIAAVAAGGLAVGTCVTYLRRKKQAMNSEAEPVYQQLEITETRERFGRVGRFLVRHSSYFARGAA